MAFSASFIIVIAPVVENGFGHLEVIVTLSSVEQAQDTFLGRLLEDFDADGSGTLSRAEIDCVLTALVPLPPFHQFSLFWSSNCDVSVFNVIREWKVSMIHGLISLIRTMMVLFNEVKLCNS
jgi:hypothetical protein